MRETGRRLCQRLLQRWMSKDSKPLREGVQTWIQQEWERLDLGSEQMIGRLRDACTDLLRQAPEDAFLAAVQPLAERCEALPAGKKAGPAVGTAAAGRGGRPRGAGSADRQTHGRGGARRRRRLLGQRLREAAEKVVSQWGQKLAETSVQLIEEPQFRLAGAEEAIRQVVASIEQILQHHEPFARDLSAKAMEAYTHLRMAARPGDHPATTAKAASRRPHPSASDVLELLKSYPKWRFQSLVLQQASAAFLRPARPPVRRGAEINFCRVRLAELQRLLETPTESVESEPCAAACCCRRGAKTLRRAWKGCWRVGTEALLELDGRIQNTIREQFTALVHICLASATS